MVTHSESSEAPPRYPLNNQSSTHYLFLDSREPQTSQEEMHGSLVNKTGRLTHWLPHSQVFANTVSIWFGHSLPFQWDQENYVTCVTTWTFPVAGLSIRITKLWPRKYIRKSHRTPGEVPWYENSEDIDINFWHWHCVCMWGPEMEQLSQWHKRILTEC